MLIVPYDLLERVILVLLFAALLEFVEGDREDDVEQNSDGLAVEDHTLEQPVVVDVIDVFNGDLCVIFPLVSVEAFSIPQFVAFT